MIIAVAALNLVLDFDLIESGVAQGAPRYMEWYGAFGLLVTLVWLYLEILRFLSKVAALTAARLRHALSASHLPCIATPCRLASGGVSCFSVQPAFTPASAQEVALRRRRREGD